MEGSETMTKRPDKRAFFERVEAAFGGKPLAELSDDELILAVSASQYATDMALVEAERRGLAHERYGAPYIPFALPEGVDIIETILTRPR
jgi:hypothetical protein